MMYGDEDLGLGDGLPGGDDGEEMGAVGDVMNETIDEPDTYGTLYSSTASQQASQPKKPVRVPQLKPRAYVQSQTDESQRVIQGATEGPLSGSFNVMGVKVPKVAAYGLGALALYKLFGRRR